MRRRRYLMQFKWDLPAEYDPDEPEVTIVAEAEPGYPPPRHNGPDDPRYSDPGAGDEVNQLEIYRDGRDIGDELPEWVIDHLAERVFERMYEQIEAETTP